MTIFATPAERAAFEAGFAEGRQTGNREMIEVLTSAETLPSLMPEQGSLTLSELARRVALSDPDKLATLRPFDKREAVPLKTAAEIAGRSESALREWAARYGIGRAVVGSLMVSRPALLALLDDDALALAALLSGRRDHPAARPYLERAGIGMAA